MLAITESLKEERSRKAAEAAAALYNDIPTDVKETFDAVTDLERALQEEYDNELEMQNRVIFSNQDDLS